MSTMEYVKPEHWDKKVQRVGDRFCELFDEYFEVNTMLDELDQFVRKTYNDHRRERRLCELTPEVLKKKIRIFLNGEIDEDESIFVDVLEYYKQYVKRRSKQTSLSYSSIKGACFTGFRFNRWGEINEKNIKEQNGKRVLEVFIKKGRAKRVVIPLHPTVEKIMEHYNWKLPKLNEGQVFNRNLKELCQAAGF